MVRVSRMLEGPHAEHKVWYSSRPLIDMGRAAILGPDDEERVEYTLDQENGDLPIIHERPAIEFVQAIYRLRAILQGQHRERSYGILRGSSHNNLLRRIGRADEIPKRKRKLVGGYRDNGRGYEYVSPKDMHRS